MVQGGEFFLSILVQLRMRWVIIDVLFQSWQFAVQLLTRAKKLCFWACGWLSAMGSNRLFPQKSSAHFQGEHITSPHGQFIYWLFRLVSDYVVHWCNCLQGDKLTLFPEECLMVILWNCCFWQHFTTHFHLVDPASSHMLVSKIKPCMSEFKLIFGETANGSLYQL